MSRISYSEDEDYPGQFSLWQANCIRSLQGKRGTQELKSMRDALIALTDKRLIRGSLIDEDGSVCAIGAYAQHNGVDLSTFDPECDSDEVGIVAGMPRMVAWKVVEMNDIEFDHLTPERRYEKMLEWANRMIDGTHSEGYL